MTRLPTLLSFYVYPVGIAEGGGGGGGGGRGLEGERRKGWNRVERKEERDGERSEGAWRREEERERRLKRGGRENLRKGGGDEIEEQLEEGRKEGETKYYSFIIPSLLISLS